MNKDYRFAHRKGRAIQVMFNNDFRWISTGCHTMPEAEAWVDAHLHTIKKDITLREYADGFFAKADPQNYRARNEKLGHHYSDDYYQLRQSMLDRYILSVHGSFKLKDITPRMVENLLFKIDRANDTRNKILFVYRTVLQSAKDDLLIANNPAAETRLFAEESKKREVYSAEELKILFPADNDELQKVWGGLWWATYFLVLHETGWRPSEVAALHRSNIYPEKLAIYTSSSVKSHIRQIQNKIKTSGHGFDYKIGFVSERTMKLLQAHGDENGYLFKMRGKFMRYDVANYHLNKVCKRCGVAFKTQYSFRHTFDSQLFGAVPDEFRKMLMGHSGKSNYDYLHLKPEEAIERAERLKAK